MSLLKDRALTRLGWAELTERSWHELEERGLPWQLVEFSRDLSHRKGRRIVVFTMPTFAAGVASLAVPFLNEDGVVLDPSLVGRPDQMTKAIARELAFILYPGWEDPRLVDYDQMTAFASVLSRTMLARLPRRVSQLDTAVKLALRNIAS